MKAAPRYDTHRRDIEKILRDMGVRLDSHRQQFVSAGSKGWDLSHVKDLLQEALDALRGD
jgi:hypothetical protein